MLNLAPATTFKNPGRAPGRLSVCETCLPELNINKFRAVQKPTHALATIISDTPSREAEGRFHFGVCDEVGLRGIRCGDGEQIQLVKQRTENPRVGGSIPPWPPPAPTDGASPAPEFRARRSSYLERLPRVVCRSLVRPVSSCQNSCRALSHF